jgi:hypothetical protein
MIFVQKRYPVHEDDNVVSVLDASWHCKSDNISTAECIDRDEPPYRISMKPPVSPRID